MAADSPSTLAWAVSSDSAASSRSGVRVSSTFAVATGSASPVSAGAASTTVSASASASLATGAASGNLVVFADGEVVAETGGFSAPHDVALDAAGGIWVADAGNDRLVRLDADLRVTDVLAGTPYDFSGPRYMDFDGAGRLYVADKYSHRIKVIAADGELLQVLGGDGAGLGEGVFDRPEGVEIRGDNVWFADTYNDRIVRYRVRERAP